MNQAGSNDPAVVIVGIVVFMMLLFGTVLLIARRGRPLDLSLVREPRLDPMIPTESGGPGGSFEAELDRLRAHDTQPAPAPALPPAPCKVCQGPATRMMPASGRGERMRHGGAIALGAGVEMDHHGDRLYGQPRPEVIHTAPGSDLCETHELVAFRLLERFHAGQRARMSELTGELALEAAAFEGGGLMRELSRLSSGKARPRGKA
jgi:hypothetical protein